MNGAMYQEVVSEAMVLAALEDEGRCQWPGGVGTYGGRCDDFFLEGMAFCHDFFSEKNHQHFKVLLFWPPNWTLKIFHNQHWVNFLFFFIYPRCINVWLRVLPCTLFQNFGTQLGDVSKIREIENRGKIGIHTFAVRKILSQALGLPLWNMGLMGWNFDSCCGVVVILSSTELHAEYKKAFLGKMSRRLRIQLTSKAASGPRPDFQV